VSPCVVSEYSLSVGAGQEPCKQIRSWSSYISKPHFHCCEATHISMASACLRSWSDRGPLCGWLSEFIQAPQCNLNNQLAFLTMEVGGWLDVCVPMFISCWSAVLSHYLIDDCYQNGQLWPHRLASFQTAHYPPHFLFLLGCYFHSKLFKIPVNTIVFADPKGCKRYHETYSPVISTFNRAFSK